MFQMVFALSPIHVSNIVDVPKEQTDRNKLNELRVQLKRGRLAGSKDKNP